MVKFHSCARAVGRSGFRAVIWMPGDGGAMRMALAEFTPVITSGAKRRSAFGSPSTV